VPACVRWLEIAPENYMARGGRFARDLAECSKRWPIVTHGLTLSLGSVDPLDTAHLDALGEFVRRIGSPWHSDHLCFAGVDGAFVHDLLPLPATDECVQLVASRIVAARNAIGVDVAIENIASYIDPPGSEFDECTFVRRVVERSGAWLLLDVNNVFVNATNRGLDPFAMIDRFPLDRVIEIHVAGHRIEDDGFRIDTHGESVCDEVFALLDHTLRRTGPVPVLLERDQNFPEWEDLVRELEQVDAIWKRCAAATEAA
jgi:uncharacterized protein (UPF0276 family)